MDMPMKKRRTAAAQAAAREPLPEVPAELLDHLVKGPMTPSEVQDLFLSFQKAVIERTMAAEMNLHLGYRPGEDKPEGQANERNGASGKTLLTERGPVRVELPRDRDGSFAPILIPKHERRFAGFDDRIIAMYARGMSVREIQAFLAELRHRGLAGLHQLGHRRGHGRDHRLAEPTAGGDVPGGVLRRAAGQDPRRRRGQQQGGVPGPGRAGRRPARRAGPVGRADRGAKFWLKVFNELKTRGARTS